MPLEVTSVADDLVVLHDGPVAHRFEDLTPGTEYELMGVAVRTLARPRGERLCTFATANDVHFGEVECGVLDDATPDQGPIMRVGPGERPHPEVMSRAAVAEMAILDPVAVIVKGDLTCVGTRAEYDAFLDCYQGAFGERLHHVRGNHDAMAGLTYADGPSRIDLPGLTVALLDTVIPGKDSGGLDADQLAWLDEVAASAGRDGRPVAVMAHHFPWNPASATRPDSYFGLSPEASEALLAVVARRGNIVGTFAGHSHRNRRRLFPATGAVPHVEVACVKDFPGTWAEYRVFEGGVLQVHHRTSTPDAIAWSERCRGLYRDFGVDYPPFALGAVDDHSFAFGLTR